MADRGVIRLGFPNRVIRLLNMVILTLSAIWLYQPFAWSKSNIL